jgi:imidazolonepropionase-like amidohydrolase
MHISKILPAVLILISAPVGYASSPPILIKDGTVITVTKGMIENSDVLIRGGRIEKIGRAIQPPPDAIVISATGKFVMPGIIDVHSHIGVYSWPDVPANDDGNEDTDPIMPQVRAEDSFNADDPAIRRAVAGGVTTIQSLPGSANLVGGQTLVLKLKPGKNVEQMRIADAPAGMKMALGENPKMTYGERNQMPSTRMGNIAVMRQWFIKAREYNEKWARYEEKKKRDKNAFAPERDLKLEALGDILKGKYLVHVHCYMKDEMLKMNQVADEFGFKIRSFIHALEAYKIADTLAARGIAACTWTDWWGFKMEAWDGIPQAPGILAAHGVRVDFHSDSPNQIQRLWLDAAKAVRYGMDRQKAFEALTINAAWVLGLDNRIGSIEEGKDADIAIFSGYPFNIYSLVDMTIVDGEIVFDRSKVSSPLEVKHEN